MEIAKVSPAYERRRSRKRTADEKEASGKARRARKYAWKPYWNALCLALPKDTVMSRSMTKVKQSETQNEKIVLYVVVENPEIMDDPHENVVVEPIVGRAGERVAAEPPVISANATMERWNGETEWWEEWPLNWTYEEQWMWWSPEGVWPDVGGRPYWELPMSGTFGCVAGDDGDEPWGDDIWNLRGKN